MSSRSLLSAFVGLSLLQPLTAAVQAPTGDKTPQTTNSSPGIPMFYAHTRQVIVEAEVWKGVDKKNANEASWIPQALPGLPDGGAGAIKILKLMRPPAPGLMANDFHVFDNGVEQRINYFKEADFAAVASVSEAYSLWVVDPVSSGIWATLHPNQGIPYAPAATYIIGYIPPGLQPGECHTIKVVVQNHYVRLSRNQYCALKDSDATDEATPNETKLWERLQNFAASTASGAIKVSVRAFAFWSSGVLSLAGQAPSSGNAPVLPGTDFTYVVEVHDSKAPATVQVATEFGSLYQEWKYPCAKNAAMHVLGMVYNTNGEPEGQFRNSWRCDRVDTPMTQPMAKFGAFVLVPSLFDTQIELRPGEYVVRVAVSDGTKFGRAQVPLRVESLDAKGLTMSDMALNSILRDASWVVRDAAKTTPYAIVPAPLVSKNVEFLPMAGAQIGRRNSLSVYFEIYEPLLETKKVDVYYGVKIIDVRSGSLVMDTGQMSAAEWVVPGNAVIPVGLKLATEELPTGSYQLEIQASDSAGRQTGWRQTNFTIK